MLTQNLQFHSLTRRLILLILVLMVPAFAQGATYYVNKAGRDSNTCSQAQSSGTAKLTIAAGITCMIGGDTLIIGDGTYAEAARRTIPNGNPGAPTVIQAEHRNGVIMRPTSGANVFNLASQSYITIDGIDADGVNISDAVIEMYTQSTFAHHIIVKNGTVRNGHTTYGQGIDGMFDDSQFLNLDVHDNRDTSNTASNWVHGFYISGSRNIVDGSRIYNNGYAGIQISDSFDDTGADNNIVRNNIIYNNVNGAVYINSGVGTLFYNNIVYGNGQGVELLANSSGIGNVKVYNNTIYSNRGNACVDLREGSSHIVRDNICYRNAFDGIGNHGGSGTASNNLLGIDPKFTNAAGADFTLQSGSPAIDAGMDLSTTLSVDIIGTTRPQNLVFDIGAYEYRTSQVSSPSSSTTTSGQLAPPTNLRVLTAQ